MIKLAEFGTFRVTISSEGVETNISNIKRLKTLFRPGSEFSNQLNNVKFSKNSDNTN